MSLAALSFSCDKERAPSEFSKDQFPLDERGELSPFQEQFADLRLLRYPIPGFKDLTLQQKKLAYYLTQAGLAGRDIMWDQNFKHNLAIRRTLEAIVKDYKGDRESEDFKKFIVYVKRVWASNGIHHHYSNDKLVPQFSADFFKQLVLAVPEDSFKPYPEGVNSREDLVTWLNPLLFDPQVYAKKVNLEDGVDKVVHSAVNFYGEGVSEQEATAFYQKMTDTAGANPPSFGLNSRLVKQQDGSLAEEVYKVGGRYSAALTEVNKWLRKAVEVAETDLQKQSLEKLIAFYETGDLVKFDEFNALWVKDTEPRVDFVNGFIEVYNDPLGFKGSFESVVSIKDMEATAQHKILGEHADYFEQASPIDPRFKKDAGASVSYKIINVVNESGDSSPTTPIGINLPNANWIRSQIGSKSVSLGNIIASYEQDGKGSGSNAEFLLPEYQQLVKDYGSVASRITVALHEVIGHASGKILDGVGRPAETLKSYASTLEEARADLVGLYFVGNSKLVEWGISPSTDVRKAEYVSYLTNGLIRQMVRIEKGRDLEEAHMRNRQTVSKWVFERGNAKGAVEMKVVQTEEGPAHYIVIHDFDVLQDLFGQLLAEIQRIKSEGDYEAGKNLVETYGVKLDKEIHQATLRRWKKLNIAPYGAFINPQLELVTDSQGNVTDVVASYQQSFTEQMLDYAKNHSFL